MNNEKGNEKKGLFARLVEHKPKKNSNCCNIVIEQIPEEIIKGASESYSKEKGANPSSK